MGRDFHIFIKNVSFSPNQCGILPKLSVNFSDNLTESLLNKDSDMNQETSIIQYFLYIFIEAYCMIDVSWFISLLKHIV